jgi:hypothetical protein
LRRLIVSAVAPAVVVLAAAGLLAVTSAEGAPQRTLVAAVDLAQTCPERVQPRKPIPIQAMASNTGDVPLLVTRIMGDAGTENESDDFTPAYQSGDTDGDGLIDPGEHWVYTGTYTTGVVDALNNVDIEATGIDGTEVSDLAPCATDVIQTPMPGVIVGVQEVKGKVLVKVPGSNTWVDLTHATEIPIGSQVNTVRGVVRITAGLGGGRTNSANFYDGIFKILQKRARNAYMTLRLEGGNLRLCRGGRALSTRALDARRKSRRLWGSGKGRFTTRGRYSSATVRGTKWLTQDTCNGTLTLVVRGVVKVRDFRRHVTVNVRAGHSYLAGP